MLHKRHCPRCRCPFKTKSDTRIFCGNLCKYKYREEQAAREKELEKKRPHRNHAEAIAQRIYNDWVNGTYASAPTPEQIEEERRAARRKMKIK